jgi:high-affinity iron transporter
MLATFVIGLREGLEAALIVGIVAAFIKREGRPETLRLVWLGVVLATAICAAIAVGLQILSANLPQAQQEALETVISVVAVLMVTYMIVWMRRHSRDLKGQLEGAAGSALATGTAWALVGMAFLAVLREGFETAVFMLAAFQASTSALAAGFGAVAGIAVAVAIGYGIYRGGVRINLSRFFRLTGLVLVFIAAGLVASALHTGHEAGWVNVGQETALDLSWLIQPGTPLAALVTGVFGLQPKPTVIEGIGWLLYFIPMSLYVMWPQRRSPSGPSSRAAPRTAEQDTQAPAAPAVY